MYEALHIVSVILIYINQAINHFKYDLSSLVNLVCLSRDDIQPTRETKGYLLTSIINKFIGLRCRVD